jgi:DNA polymerase/3'-5' exonuclease PolX
MNSDSIATYIANLEKENADLKKRLRKCEEERDMLEYENMFHYVDSDLSDEESVASDSESYNAELTDALDEIAYEEENQFKRAVYKKAADTIYHLDFKVTQGEQLADLPGIGKGIINKVNEFLNIRKIFDTNENIAEQLENLAQESRDMYKINAYQKAAEAIRKLPFEVTNGTDIWKGPTKVSGIGRGIAHKIDEYIVTGRIRRV